MPLKPIFEKSPLVVLKSHALRPGQARTSMNALSTVYQLAGAYVNRVSALEGLIRLSAILTDKPLEEPAAKQLEALLKTQREDGSFPMEPWEEVALMRSAFAMYEIAPSRSLLLQFGSWCAHVNDSWADFIADRRIRQSPVDMMSLLEQLYRVTGKKAILSLCEHLRKEGMDWSSVLHTFSVQKDMKKMISSADLLEGMSQEDGSEAGFYTRQYLTCHGEMLADGMRSALANGLYSGNSAELKAARIGWERISRHHGTVCGGISADETIAGLSPSAAIDAASVGAWAEALASQDAQEDCGWACEALMLLTENALKAAAQGGQLIPYQRVNSLKPLCGTADCQVLHEEEDQKLRSLTRLTRGWAAVFSNAVAATQRGVQLNQYLEGAYTLPVKDSVLRLTVNGDNGKYSIRIAAKTPVEADFRFYIPEWAKDACVNVNQEGGDEGKPGSWLTITRTWKTGDSIDIDLGPTYRVVEGYHQSQSILYGARLMAMTADAQSFAYALVGVDGNGEAQLCAIDCWKQRNGVLADLPVLPKATGSITRVTLKPYADCPCRIAAFPKGRRA